MKIMMNKDIANNKFASAIQLREIITIVCCAMIIAAGYFIHALFNLNMELCMYICIPFISVVALCGFYKRDNMTAWEIAKRKWGLLTQKMCYESISWKEYQNVSAFLRLAEKNDERMRKKRSRREWASSTFKKRKKQQEIRKWHL